MVKLIQSELKTREATVEEQTEIDRRIEKGEELFDKEDGTPKEPEKKEGEPKEPEKKAEEKKEEGKLSDAELLDKDDKDLTEEQKVKKSDLVKAKEISEKQEEDERIVNAKDEDLDKDQKARKAELLKSKENSKSEEEKQKELEGEVDAYALEHSVSKEDARKDIESISKIVDNFKGDPKKLAKSLHHLQRITSKTQEELKAFRNAPPAPTSEPTIKGIVEAIDNGELLLDGKKATKDAVIDRYRIKNRDLGDDVSDETIMKLVAKDMLAGYESWKKDNLTKLSSAAKEKKEKLLGELSEKDKEYLPIIKPIIDAHTDAQIMSENYNLKDFIQWGKGQDAEAREKAAEDRGFKRGVEARKILGEIKKPGEGSPKVKGGTKTTLTDAQKKEAEDFYANDNIPLTRKYELYTEIVTREKERKDKNKEK